MRYIIKYIYVAPDIVSMMVVRHTIASTRVSFLRLKRATKYWRRSIIII